MFNKGEKQLKTQKGTLKIKTKITDKKNMVKVVLQQKQVYNVKSSKFALITKNTMVKSPKTRSPLTGNFW